MIFRYDVLVIGGGHAGCEAARAAAKLGAKACLITMDMNKIAQMSCNPAVGGIAKGQIVREVDALGGKMGIITDSTSIQFRMLNKGKGPAVWSPRAQCDRAKFITKWRETLDSTEGLDIWQDQADELLVEDGMAVGVRTLWGAEFRAKSIVVTAGTFLNGLMHVGKVQIPGGRCAEPAVYRFSESIARHGITVDRMKTGKRHTKHCKKALQIRPFSTVKSKARGRVIVLVLRQSSLPSPIRSSIRSSLNPKVRTQQRCISTDFRRACPSMCS